VSAIHRHRAIAERRLDVGRLNVQLDGKTAITERSSARLSQKVAEGTADVVVSQRISDPVYASSALAILYKTQPSISCPPTR